METRISLTSHSLLTVSLSYFLATLLLSTIMAQEEQPQQISPLHLLSRSNAGFSSDVYNILARNDGNVFFSPISIHAVLSMTYQGAGGETATALGNVLRLSDQRVVRDGYNQLMTSLNKLPNVTLHMANKLFVQNGYDLKANFTKVTADYFLSEVQPVNFGNAVGASSTINHWVESKTNNKIRNLISPDSLDALTRLVLVNAVYFKGNWSRKFDPARTTPEPFYISPNSEVTVQMMHKTAKYAYKDDDYLGAQVLELPYANEQLSMMVILPADRSETGLSEVEEKLKGVDLTTMADSLRDVEVEVSLPKFKIETTIELKDVLTEMGLGVIFTDQADFSNLSEEPLKVTKVIQKAFIEVNEEGSEAAAATGVMMVAFSLPLPPVEFKANHPFLITIQVEDRKAPLVLFSGKITHPLYPSK